MKKSNKPLHIRQRSGIAEILRHNCKWLIIPIYLLLVYMGWNNWNRLIDIIPINNAISIYFIYKIAMDIFYILIGIIGLIGIITLIKTPVFLNRKLQKKFRKIGFKNSEGEYPELLSKRRDKSKNNGEIWEFNNVGLSLPKWGEAVADLELVLSSKIHFFEYGKRGTQKTLVYAIPKKYAKPRIISTDDNYFMKGFINNICVGATGVGKSYALLTMLGLLAKIPNVSITICDYKKSSFAQFEDTPNFYGYEDVPDGIRAFYKEFSERLEANDEQRKRSKYIGLAVSLLEVY